MKKRNAYTRAYQKHKGSIKSLLWNSYSSAAIRYKELIKDIDFNNKSILDVGCGFGDVIPFIFSKSALFNYTGTDLIDEFIKEAQKKYPDYKFITGDYFKNTLKEKFDIILCCGALNGNYGDKTLYLRKKSIKTMFDNAKEVIVFNMAGGISPINKKDSTIYYADSIEILKYCTTLSQKVILRNHYHKKDFTVIIFK